MSRFLVSSFGPRVRGLAVIHRKLAYRIKGFLL